MGEVYRATDTKLGRDVALKVLPAEMASRPERLERFRREAKALAALDHPGIVTVHSVEEADGVHFLTMQLVEGQPLDRGIPRGGLPVARILEIGTALAEALAAAHDKGIVHRDLKPANVMTTTDGRVKVLDFGLAKVTEALPAGGAGSELPTDIRTSEGMVVGTLPYMSPEQVQGLPLDHRSDIFSLGVLLHEMATGRCPFAGDNAASLASSILRDHPRPITELNPALPHEPSEAVGRCLAKMPGERYQAARDVRDALERATRAPAAAQVPGPSGTPPRPGAAPSSTGAGPSIAVLPFANMSADPENDYFSDGITEELLSCLVQLRGLKVAARTSCFAFKNQAADLRTVGERLGVSSVLEGSVRRQGRRVRITAQLVNASDGYQLWSERFDRQLDDVFGVQADIAQRVADALRVTLLQSDADRLRSPDTKSAAAYDAYLRGLQQMAAFGVASVLEAAGSFRRATELDPAFAKAHAGIANAYLFAYETAAIPLDELLRVAEPATVRAIELDPWLSEAQAARGGVLAARRDAAGARAAFQRALELNPANTFASHLYGMFLWHQWDLAEMIDVHDRALSHDPLDATLRGLRGWGLQTLGRVDEAEADFAPGRALDPDNPSSSYLGGLCSLDARGDAVEAARLLRRSTEVDPADPELFAWLAHAYLTLDEHAQGARAADRAVELGPANGLALSTRALAHACAGEEQSAFDVAGHGLEPAVLQRFGSRLLLLRILRTTLLRQGRAADAVRAYEGAYPTVGQAKSLLEAPLEHPQFGGFGELVGAAIDLAHLRKMGGDDAGAATLTRLVRGSLEREPRMQFLRLFGPGTADAQLAILEGRPKDALAALTRVVDAGWIANWRFVIEHDVIWDAIRPDPAFRRIVERLEANTQRQRAALHATNGPSKSAAGIT